ncbi:MAG: hypothetical protein GEV08_19740, partial [Acidimicrobiia bacterium]|nr:hypothetical protein [Acidimicrobiia bacterium]
MTGPGATGAGAAGQMALGDRLIDAVQAGALPTALDELRATGPVPTEAGERGLLEAATDAVRGIGRDAVAAYGALSAGLADAGVEHRPLGPIAGALGAPVSELQRIAIDVAVGDRDAASAVALASDLGYRPWYQLDRAAWLAYRRLFPALPLVAETPGGHPILLRVLWRPLGVDGSDRSGLRARVEDLSWLGRLRPTPRDLGAVALPPSLWLGHVALRPLRLARDRALRRPTPTDLGPYLPTPTSLIDALLDVAGVGPDDVV